MVKSLISSFLVEYLAAFAITFYTTNTIELNDNIQIISRGLSIFFIIMPMSWFTHKISGGHLNPLISLAALIAGKSNISTALINIIGQFSGGFSGFFVLKLIEPTTASIFYSNFGNLEIICIESITIFCLTLVFLITAHNRKISRAIYGFVVPGVYCTGALCFGALYSARFNPAWYGPSYLVDGGFVGKFFLQLCAGVVTAVVSALIYRFVLDNTKQKGVERHLLENQDTNTINF